VKCVVSTVAEQERLLRVGHLVVVVPQLMMYGGEVLFVDLDTHLEPHIFFKVDIPGAGVTDNVAIRRLGDH
jgi:hypothetical protein